MGANDMQVGGSHYQDNTGVCPHCGKNIQHWDLVAKMPYIVAQVTKYVIRFASKNGREDLEKARHYLNKVIEVYYPTTRTREPVTPVYYVASRASIPERGLMWRTWRKQGESINSSWIDQDGEGASDYGKLWPTIFKEIEAADALVLYAESEDFPLKGAFVEIGAALGMGKPVYCVLPKVVLEPRSCRPVGSWMNHPSVRVFACLEDVWAYKLGR